MNVAMPASGASANAVDAAGVVAASAATAGGEAAAPARSASMAIPFKPAAASDVGGSNFTAASLVCVAVFVLAVLALRRWGPRGARVGGAPRAVQIVESARLADRMRISVIRYRGRELLVAHSDQVATVLASEPLPSEPVRAP